MPYRIDADGSTRILLITSRGTGRWVVPKGNPIKGLDSHRAAAHEAYEEAGISGTACPTPIGSFRYMKRLKDGRQRNAHVEVFPLAFVAQADQWPEQSERETRWFGLPEAVAAVAEPELKAIIAAFRIPEQRIGLGTRAWLRVRRAIAGAGASWPISPVRWKVAGNIHISWVATLPAAAAAIAALVYWLARLVSG